MSAVEASSVVAAARQSLGPVGAYLPVPLSSAPPVSLQRTAVTRLEGAGYRTAWVNETVGGKDPLVQVALLLPATERMTFGTGIANIWARRRRSRTAPPPCWLRRTPAGSSSASGPATRSRRPPSAGSSAAQARPAWDPLPTTRPRGIRVTSNFSYQVNFSPEVKKKCS